MKCDKTDDIAFEDFFKRRMLIRSVDLMYFNLHEDEVTEHNDSVYKFLNSRRILNEDDQKSEMVAIILNAVDLFNKGSNHDGSDFVRRYGHYSNIRNEPGRNSG